jgi:hypothetical protein
METGWEPEKAKDPKYEDVRRLMDIDTHVISAQEAIKVIITYTLNADPVDLGGAMDRIFQEAECLNDRLGDIQERLHSLRSYIEAEIRNGDDNQD